MDVSLTDNVPHSLVCAEVLQEISRQGQHQFSPHGLISVHVSNEFHHGLQSNSFLNNQIVKCYEVEIFPQGKVLKLKDEVWELPHFLIGEGKKTIILTSVTPCDICMTISSLFSVVLPRE